MISLYAFLLLALFVAAVVVWFVHRTGLSDSIGGHARAYSRAYAKGTVLVLAAGLTSLNEAFSGLEKLSTDEVATMQWWSWVKVYLPAGVAICSVIAAMLDKSVADAASNGNGNGKQHAPPLPPPTSNPDKMP